MATTLLISRLPVRFHEVEHVGHFIGGRDGVSFGELSERFTPYRSSHLARGPALLKEVLGFLTALELVRSSGERRWEDRTFQAKDLGSGFRLALLARLRSFEDHRQRAFLGAYDELVAHGIMYTTIADVVNLMERSSYATCFAWNETKITFWARFFSDLGLIVYMPPSRLAVSPRSDLFLKVIPPGTHDLVGVLDAIHRTYFSVYSSFGDVHAGVAHGLLRLARNGSIELGYESDSSRSAVLHGKRLSRITRLA